jgi:hypothetical protein
VAIRKDVLVVRFQYNAAEQATWAPVILLLALRLLRLIAKKGAFVSSGASNQQF